jgi:hypothetical protein
VPIKDISLVGKKTDCGHCGYRFIVEKPHYDVEKRRKKIKDKPEPKAKKPEITVRKLQDEAREAPREPKSAVKKPPKKSAQESLAELFKGTRGQLILAGVGVFVLILAGILIFFGGDKPVPPPPNPVNTDVPPVPEENPQVKKEEEKKPRKIHESGPILGLLPDNLQVIAHLPVKDFMDTAMGDLFFRSPGAFRPQDFLERLGLRQDVGLEEVVLAGNKDHRQSFVVVRTYGEYDEATIKQALRIDKPTPEKVVNGHGYYLGKVDFLTEFLDGRIPLASLKDQAAVHFRDPHTFLYGDVRLMEQVLSRTQESSDSGATAKRGEGDEGVKEEHDPYARLDSHLRNLIPKPLGEKSRLFLLLADNKGVVGDWPASAFPYFDRLGPARGDVGVLVLDAQIEQARLHLTAVANCTRTGTAVQIRNQLEALLKLAAKQELKTLLGNEPNVGAPPVSPDPATTPDMGAVPAPAINPATITCTVQDNIVSVRLTVDEVTAPALRDHLAFHLGRLRGQVAMNSGLFRLEAGALLASVRNYNDPKSPEPFPYGAQPRRDGTVRPFPAGERLSWMCDLLPHLDGKRYEDLYQRLEMSRSWRDPANLTVGRVLIPAFLHPQDKPYFTRVRGVEHELALTHLVGMAGVGRDAAYHPKTHRDAGIFGYDRQTTLADLKDGAAQTILMIQSDPAVTGPWIAGGGATVRGTNADGTDLGQPGGFRSPERGSPGAWVLMADGSARYLKRDSVSPDVFKKLCTMAGSDLVPDLDALAPKAAPR